MQQLRPRRRPLPATFALALAAALIGLAYHGPDPLLTGVALPAPLQGRAAAAAKRAPRGHTPARSGAVSQEERGQLGRAYRQLPLTFEQNAGQFERGTSFAARGDGYSISLKPTEVVLSLRGHSRRAAESFSPSDAVVSARRRAPARVLMRMSGANPAPRIAGGGRLAGVSNYFIGPDPAAWRVGVPTFARVEYAGVYPGVDVVYYGNGRQLEYDFRLAPGANPRRIKLEFDGVEAVRLDAGGDLVLRAEGGGELRQRKPVSYQEVSGERREVESRYALAGDNRVAFELGDYDPRHQLVIDPVISYATYLGGTGHDEALAVARGADGSLYMTGETGSADFPAASSYQAALGGETDAFVLKLNPAGTAVVYATYVGGQLLDEGTGVAVDADGNAYVAGYTQSANFPVTAGALQTVRGGNTDAFALKLNPTGTTLIYSTLLGGPSFDFANGVEVDAAGRAYVAGSTHSARFINGAPMPKAGSPVYKTTDAAANWQPAEDGIDDSSGTAFAFHPTDPNTIYAGTNTGVYKTTDGGATWSLTGTGSSNPLIDPLFVTALALNPANPSTFYVATSNAGVYKTTDGGATYTRINTGLQFPVIALALHPSAPDTVYAGTILGAYKTTNGGANWTAINSGLASSPRVNKFAIDAANPSLVYAATTRGAFKTANGGTTWTAINNGLTSFGSTAQVNTILIDPTASSVLYAGAVGSGAFKSTDAGANWTPINAGLQEQTQFGTLTYSVVALAINPSAPAVLYAAANGGGAIFKTTDAGATWAASSAGVANRVPNVNALELDRTNPAILFAGFSSGSDAFAVRLSASGAAADYSVFIGGSEIDSAIDLALDAAGNAYLAGTTTANDFPLASPLQPSFGGGSDAFVSKLGPSGATLYSTYLGGNTLDEARDIAVDSTGRAHVTGYTSSANFPTAGPRQTALNSFGPDLFVARLNAAGSALDYSVLHGGEREDEGVAIALDPAGSAYVTGYTRSADFPTASPPQPAFGGGTEDAFVLKLGPASEVVYSTYLGGFGAERGLGIVADAAGSAYVVGNTTSSNFPVASPLKANSSGGRDAFVARLSPVADLALTAAASRDPVMVNNNLTYTFTLRNNGPDTAAAARLSDALPAGATFVSAAASQGSCAGTTTVACDLGSLAPQATATVTIVVKPTATGALSNSATATSDTPDPNAGDNSAGLTTNVSARPSIAGRVALPTGPLAGVTVSLAGTQSAAAQTSATGFYQFAELAQGGSYTVTPARPGYVFHPQSRAFNNLTADETADFAAVACNFTVSPANRSFTAAGGTGSINITAPDSLCPWTAQSNAPWITITSAASGTGSAVVSFSVAPATVAGRAGTITVAGHVFTVWQELDACAAPSFHVAKRSPVGGSALDSAEADFNSDGRLDLVIVRELPSSSSARLTLLLGDGAGGFGQPTDLTPTPTTPASPRSVVAADFNGDGKPDLVYGIRGSTSVVILLGDGAGGFGPATSFASGLFNSTTEVFAADLNADGKMDVATGSENEHRFAVLYGAGDGTLGAPRTFGDFGQTSNPQSFAAGDLNGDGKPELITGSGGSAGVYINDGAGGFAFARTLFNVSGSFNDGVGSVSLADLNGDGKLDLVGLGSGGVGVSLGQGGGNFAAPIATRFGGYNRHLLFADLNGDGKLDVAAGTSFGVVTLFGDGAGGLGGVVSYQTGSTPNRVALADLDADGRPDLISTEGPHISTLFGRGGGRFEAARNYPVGFQPQDVAAADFNSDGRLDLVAGVRGVNGAPGGVSFLAGDGAGRFAAPVHVPAGDQLLSLVVADFNGDGRADVAGTRHDTASVAVLLGDGAGGFAPAAAFAVGQFPRGIAAGDFNGDGKVDLAVTDVGGPNGTGRVAVLLGNGAGGFGAATGHAVAGGPFAVAAADLNADGRLDLVASSLDNSTGNSRNLLAVLLGEGAGGFAPAVSHTINSQQGTLFISNVSLVAGDFNGDGRADMAAPLPAANSIAVLHGDGAGGFAQPETYAAGTQPRDLVSADFNGDGKPDLAVAGWDSSTVSVLLGRGTGGFESPANYLTSQYPGGLAAGDFDGDARTDLAATSFGASIFGGGDATIFLNACAPPSVVQLSAATYQVGEGDQRATVTITRSGDTSGAAAVDYRSTDSDTFTVGCADAAGAQGKAYARCDFATTVGTVSFAAGETSKTVTVPVIDDGHVEGAETFQFQLSNPTGATLGSLSTATVAIQDNDASGAPNPVLGPPHDFFVRQQYLDFLSREPDAGGLAAWLNVLNTCPNVNAPPETPSGCDRIHVSGEGFFRSTEFRLKASYAFRFYKVAFARLPEYLEIVSDMSFVAGATEAEVYARRAQLAERFAARPEFGAAYGTLTNQQFVAALLGRYNLQQVTTPDPANPDTGAKVTLTAAALAALPRDKALRAVVDSDEVGAAEFDNAFVAMQYYGYLRRKPEPGGYEAWLRVLRSGDMRTMVNGFLNSQEYRLRFGQP